MAEPDDQFVKFFFDTLCPDNHFRGALKENFLVLAPQAFKDFIRDEIDSLLNEAAMRQESKQEPKEELQPSEQPTANEVANRIETTPDELEGYYIVKSILHGSASPDRVAYKDTQNYFNILFDGKAGKPLCRFYFNSNTKRIGLFDKGGGNAHEEKVAITCLDDLYHYADRLKATVPHYHKLH